MNDGDSFSVSDASDEREALVCMNSWILALKHFSNLGVPDKSLAVVAPTPLLIY